MLRTPLLLFTLSFLVASYAQPDVRTAVWANGQPGCLAIITILIIGSVPVATV
ncbi:uncharacterized protein METZ01_LOCUS392417, partial [marine metagenome]